MGQLMIVESPAKAKKIQKMLGDGYTVKSSLGHIRDLPRNDLGVDLDTLAPTYEVNQDKKDVVAQLRKQAKGTVILATDDDREGEAIAWHLQKALGIGDNYQRIVYGQVTREAIQSALNQPRSIDTNLVSAQEARRVLDRLIGYIVSPALSERAGVNLSAGRVQSVAVRIVVERERAIANFTPQPYYEPVLVPDGHPEIEAHLVLDEWVGESDKHLFNQAVANQFGGPTKALLKNVAGKSRRVNPRPPFITVSLQEAAGSRFGMDGSSVMAAAQGLFDNGHITYHRTDNPNLSPEGFGEIQQYLTAQGLPHADTQPHFDSKADAQQAHEAIRPVAIDQPYAGNSEDEQRVYKLIRERALTSAMPAGEDELTQMLFEDQARYLGPDRQPRTATFVAKGRVVRDPGWRAYAEIEPVESKDTPLPKLTKGQVYAATTRVDQKKTEPPKRFTEPSLTKALESYGIGRPATYAAIIANIKDRGYILPMGGKKKKNANEALIPGDNGYYVVDALINMQFMSYKYTRDVEATLDLIARGDRGYANIVRPVLAQIQDDVANRMEGESLVRTEACPNCGKRVAQKQAKNNRDHHFWMHMREADAEGCYKFLDDVGGVPGIPQAPEKADCPNCSQPIKRLPGKGKNGPFWVHANRDHAEPCGHTFIDDDNGTPKLREPIKTATCLLCGETLKRLYSRKNHGHFWVHDADEPDCSHKTFPDNEGEPDFPASS